MSSDENKCLICNELFDDKPTDVLKERALKTMRDKAKEYDDTHLKHAFLSASSLKEMTFHQKCRRDYMRKKTKSSVR